MPPSENAQAGEASGRAHMTTLSQRMREMVGVLLMTLEDLEPGRTPQIVRSSIAFSYCWNQSCEACGKMFRKGPF
jgi:hypothetical protein